MANSKVDEKVDECIMAICDMIINDDVLLGECAATVSALASLVEARAGSISREQGGKETMDKLEWINAREERLNAALEENQRRRELLESELTMIRELKEVVKGDIAEVNKP